MRLSATCRPQLLARSSSVGNIASTTSSGTPALSAISGQVVAWIPFVVWSSREDSMMRSRVGSTSRGSPGWSPYAPLKPRRRASRQKSELVGCCAAGASSSAVRPRGVSCQYAWRPTLRRVTRPLSSSRRPVRLTCVSSVSSRRRSSVLPSWLEPPSTLRKSYACVPWATGASDGARSSPQCAKAIAASSQPISSRSASPARARALRSAWSARSRVSAVADENRVDQAERDGLLAPGIRVEPRDPRQEGPFPRVV